MRPSPVASSYCQVMGTNMLPGPYCCCSKICRMSITGYDKVIGSHSMHYFWIVWMKKNKSWYCWNLTGVFLFKLNKGGSSPCFWEDVLCSSLCDDSFCGVSFGAIVQLLVGCMICICCFWCLLWDYSLCIGVAGGANISSPLPTQKKKHVEKKKKSVICEDVLDNVIML